jgi:hypothetical protein
LPHDSIDDIGRTGFSLHTDHTDFAYFRLKSAISFPFVYCRYSGSFGNGNFSLFASVCTRFDMRDDHRFAVQNAQERTPDGLKGKVVGHNEKPLRKRAQRHTFSEERRFFHFLHFFQNNARFPTNRLVEWK